MFIYRIQENNLGIIVCKVDTNENIEYRYFQGLLSYPIHDKLKLLKSYDQIQEYLKTLFEWLIKPLNLIALLSNQIVKA
jgi:hypothetical protein